MLGRTAEVDVGDRMLRLPLRRWALRIGSAPRSATYLVWGYPELRDPAPPWRHLEQMGAAHRLTADGAELMVVTRRRAHVLTECRLVARAREAGA